jgi:hypothetical protein
MVETLRGDQEQASGYLPSIADVEFYREHGWFVTPAILPDSLIDQALAGLHQHWSGHRDSLLPLRQGYADWMPGDGDGTRNNEYISLQNHAVQKLAWHRTIGLIAAHLAGADTIRLFDDQIVCKPACKAASSVGWHVDGDYWGTCSSSNLLTAWIPFHDCPVELGPLAVVDGSHKWSHEIDRTRLSFHSQDMESLAQLAKNCGHEFVCRALGMKKGQVSFHHARTIHGSFPNVGSRPRIALALHMQPGSNRYQPCLRPDGKPVQLFNDLICRKNVDGLPDYTDDLVFPVLWGNSESNDRN